MFSRSLKTSLLLFSILLTQSLYARSLPELNVKNIPSSISNGADLVIREFDEVIDIDGPKSVRITDHYIITLLSPAAGDARYLSERSSTLESLDDISATLYNADGDELKSIRKKEFKNYPLNIGSAGFSDIIRCGYYVDYAVYPFTIEFRSTRTCNHNFQIPVWSPQYLFVNGKIAIEKAQLRVNGDRQSGFRYKMLGLDPPQIINEVQKQSWIWSINSKHAEPKELLSAKSYPALLMQVDHIAVDDFEGSAESWKQLGLFINKMNLGRDQLIPEDKLKVHELTDSLKDTRLKISVLYLYLQQRTRYVAVELGVGGWQTLDAAFVGKNQYGDCKGLSNYLMSLLKEAGIVSYPVLISAKENYLPLQRDFPATYFNHEILCVPIGADTTWLECTSQDNTPGYLGTFTEDRDALLLTEAGGVVVHTPSVNWRQNILNHRVSATLDDQQHLEMKFENQYTADWCDRLRPNIQHMNDESLRQYVGAKFKIPSYTVESFRYEPIHSGAMPCWKEYVNLSSNTLVSQSGKRVFINTDLIPFSMPEAEEDADRKSDFLIPVSYLIVDSFTIHIPSGLKLESLPKGIETDNLFGSCQITMNMTTPDIICIFRKLKISSGKFSAAQYSQFIDFLTNIRKASSEKLVLIKQ